MAWSHLRKQFHKFYWCLWTNWSNGSVHHSKVDPSEGVTRFLVRRNEFGTNPRRVTHHAFLPNFNSTSNRFEKSVHRTDRLSTADLWKLGKIFVQDEQHQRIVKARAAGAARSILGAGLRLAINSSPWPRHADIVDWPDGKDAQKIIAISIANGFALEMAP
jgi:hypothetical protein